MRPVKTAKQLVEDPADRYLVGASFVVWIQRTDRLGMFHTTNMLDRADQGVLVQVFPLITSPRLAPRYDLLHDLAALDQLDVSGFAFFEAFLARWVDVISQRVRRLVVVRPPGIAGAAIGGMFRQWVSHLDARLCTTRCEAYEFLDVDDADRRALDALSDDGLPALRRVRDYLARNLTDATLPRVAAELGLAVRSLQRLLGEHDTSFRDELALVRLRTAENRLIDSDDKLEVIAEELGFSSASSFVRMFERANGCAPGEFRQRYRSGPENA